MRKISSFNMAVVILFLVTNFFSCQKDPLITPEKSGQKTQEQVSADSIMSDSTSISATENATLIADYYVAPNGSDSNPGTILKPFKTWQKAVDVATPGKLIYLRGGTYYTDKTKSKGIHIKKSGSSSSLIKLWAYPNEIPILKCGGNNTIGIAVYGSYWHIKGVEVTGVKEPAGHISRGIYVENGIGNIFEQINSHHNEGPGLLIVNNSKNNLVKNCDFHDNYDPLHKGGNADGLQIAFIPKGNINRISGCRVWNNSDDGMDFWRNEGIVYIENSWVWHNGYIPGTEAPSGNGQGIKLGKTVLAKDATPQRYVKNCKSFLNRTNGYDQNSANVIIDFRNNVAYKNKNFGVYFNTSYPNKHLVYNNTATNNQNTTIASKQINFNSQALQQGNSWQSGITLTYLSTNTKEALYARKADGSLPDINFLKVPK